MRKLLSTLIILCFTTGFSLAQELEWAHRTGGNFSDFGHSITTDADSNVYVTGYYQGTADLDPGSGVLNVSSNGSLEVFVQKLDKDGNLIWARSFGGLIVDMGNSIAVDNDGNVYTAGRFSNTVDFDPGSGVTSYSANGLTDFFIQKLDANGDFVWAVALGSAQEDGAEGIDTDVHGNVYCTGYFGAAMDFDPGTGVENRPTTGGVDIFVLKLDENGNLVWVVTQGSGQSDSGLGIAVDGDSNVYTTGYFRNTVDFDPGLGVNNLSSNGSQDIYLQKLNSSGNLVWAASAGAGGVDHGRAIALVGDTHVISTGYFGGGSVDFDPGSGSATLVSSGGDDAYVQKLDSAGNYIWAKAIAGSGFDQGYGIATDLGGNVFSTGYFGATIDFDPGVGVFNASSNGFVDTYVHALNANGDFLWATAVGGTSNDEGRDIAVGPGGGIYSTGAFMTFADFDPGSGVLTLTAANGVQDIYVQKLSYCTPALVIDTLVACDSLTWIDGNTYYADNNTSIFVFPGASVNGCDSIVSLHLTIDSSSFDTITQEVCYSYTAPSGAIFTSSGQYSDTIPNAIGCDSIIAINLTVNQVATGSITEAACITYASPSGQVFNVTGVYTDSLMSAAGCDSLLTIDLTIYQPSDTAFSVEVCESYTAPSGQVLTASGVYTDSVLNVNGCDSMLTIDLTILPSSDTLLMDTACGSYTSVNGKEWTESGTYFDTLQNALGCDSIITYELNIITIDTSVNVSGDTLTAVEMGSYQWLNCTADGYMELSGETAVSYVATVGGNYAVEIEREGCIDTSACIEIELVGLVESENFANRLSLYPNPITEAFMLHLGQTYEEVVVKLKSSDGRLIQEQSFNGIQELEMGVKQPAGLYLLEVYTSEGDVAVLRVMKR